MNSSFPRIGRPHFVFALFLGAGFFLPIYSGATETAELTPAAIDPELSDRAEFNEILEKSQISYRADGGFTQVESYSVILSCVKGRVSVMTSIQDPRLASHHQIRQVRTMPVERYVALWNNLERNRVMKLTNGQRPKHDIADEFTITFNASIGDRTHSFEVTDIKRPAAARYFAVRQLIDDAVEMNALWSRHTELVKLLPQEGHEN